jgi:NAD(P)-dependent dehydrogenase (short-subunit alcohol dehydrogenase family)
VAQQRHRHQHGEGHRHAREAARARERALAPLDRVANRVAFPLSDEASFATGANRRVDGGVGARFAG